MTRTEDRLAAARAVGRVLRSGAWSNVVTRTEAASSAAEVSVVQGLTFSVLRHRPLVDSAIGTAAGRRLERIDQDVLDVLRVAVAELVAGRTPPPLVVDGAVHAVRSVSPRAAGFANAVLRRVAADPPTVTSWADVGIPEFVDTSLRRILEPDEVDALWAASQQAASVAVRALAPPEGASPVEGIPGAWLVADGANLEEHHVQDPASVAVGNAVGATPGSRALDVGAAPGGKTAHLVEQVGSAVTAVDLHPRRVRDAARRVPAAHWVVADGADLPFQDLSFDVILVDAPCTGLGTLRRRPELRERVGPEEMARLAATQRSMLEEALRVVVPGGRVVYSVCTVTPAETIDVVAGLGAVAPAGLPGRPYGDGWLMAPHLGPTDGMFVAVFDR